MGYLNTLFNEKLRKDLHENQILCPHCKGTGLEITDQRYGLSDDPDRTQYFPYHNQYLIPCRYCYTGVLNVCKYCGKELPRGYQICDCEKAKLEKQEEENIKHQELMNKAIKLKYDEEKVLHMEMLFSDDYSHNEGYFTDWEEFFEDWHENHIEADKKPKYVWGTECQTLSIDAFDIVERACEELHEDAFDNVSDINDLEEFLNKWCSKQTGTSSYYPTYKTLIEIPWELDC